MPFVDYALLCNAAQVDVATGLVSILGGGLDRVGAPQLPVNILVTVVARIVWSEQDLGSEYPFRVRVHHEDDEELARVDGTQTPTRTDGMDQDFPVASLIVLTLPLQFRRAGRYYVEIRVNDELLKESPLVVLVGDGR